MANQNMNMHHCKWKNFQINIQIEMHQVGERSVISTGQYARTNYNKL